jgi:alpha-galactosidase
MKRLRKTLKRSKHWRRAMKLEYKLLAAASEGPFCLTGQEEAAGAVHIRAAVPESVLQSVTAVLPVSLADGEKIFMNGYQTWTYCPEYERDSRIRGLHGVWKPLVRAFSLDRYGDYHFTAYPNKKGVTHGFSWCYFRLGGRFRLIASLDERPGYTQFLYDSAARCLTITRDCAGLKVKGSYAAFDLYFAEGTENEVFDGWFSELGCKSRANAPLTGYSSWYNRYQDISAQSICEDLTGCASLLQPGDLFQIDDGWEKAVGDYLAPDEKKFPDGMACMAERIHTAGFRAGLWLAPFVCQKDSALFREHPDWCLQADGGPYRCGCNWGGFYALDIDRPEVLSYLRAVFDRVLNEWKFDLVKLDFLYAAAPFGTDNETRAGRMCRAAELLRSLCGEKQILGCGTPLFPAFGLFDYCRIGCDVGLDWDDKLLMRLIHRERVSTKHAISNTLFRRALDGRAFGSDPDVFFLRDENLRLTDAQKLLLARVNSLFGSVFMISDNPASYPPAVCAQYRALRENLRARDVHFDADTGRVQYTLGEEAREFRVPAR